MKAAVYARFSSSSQSDQSQRFEIERYLAGNNIANAIWFVDCATGNNLARPQFEALQRAIFNGEVDTVITYKLDRISRSLVQGINVLCSWLKQNIRVIAITQQLDFAGVTGQLVASVLFAVAEMEQSTRRDRQRAGIEAAKANGVYLGRKKGSTKKKPQRALELRDKGLNVDEIAVAMNVSKRTVFNYLASSSEKVTQ